MLLITEAWTKEEHQGFLAMIRAHWRGWNLVLFEDRASQHTSPDSRAWADDLGIEVRLLPKATPELNAMDHLWKPVKGQISANWQWSTVDEHADHAERWVLGLSDREALRKAGILSEDFWLAHL